MARRHIIRKGDKTTHGGTVLEGYEYFVVKGKPVTLVKHKVQCPLCEGVFEIIGNKSPFLTSGMPVALEGMKTSCGAMLIPSQNVMYIDDPTWFLAPLKEFIPPRCEHSDGAIEVAKYIVDEIQRNSKSSMAQTIQDMNAQPLNLLLLQAMALWTAKVREDGNWDHKRKIREGFSHLAVKKRPFKSKVTKSGYNSSSIHYHKYKYHDYFYDVWSNIHYGYLGRVCGFSESELLDGAGLEQIGQDLIRLKKPKDSAKNEKGLRSFDNIADRDTISLGIGLFNRFKSNVEQLTYQHVLDALERLPKLDDSRLKHLCFDTSIDQVTQD